MRFARFSLLLASLPIGTTTSAFGFLPQSPLTRTNHHYHHHRNIGSSLFRQQKQDESSTTGLFAVVALGPTGEELTGDIDYSKLVPGVDFEVPDHESQRTARRSKLDERVDEWFGSLLNSSGDNSNGMLGEIAQTAREQLLKPVELKNELPLPPDHPDFTPYVQTKLPWAVIHPAYGLEEYGLPMPRRNAEAWRHFDVTGMTRQDYSQTVQGSGTDMELSESESSELQAKLLDKGAWLDDDACYARLIYVNGRYVPSLSKTTETIHNLNAADHADVIEQHKDVLGRLTDGFTDELMAPVPSGPTDFLTSFRNLSKPDHNFGDPYSQYSINAQQGTACFAALNTVKTGAVAYIRFSEQNKVETAAAAEDNNNDNDDSKEDTADDTQSELPVLLVNAVTADGGGSVMDDDATKGVAMHPRALVIAEDGSHLAFVQSMVDLDDEMDESVTSIPKLYNGYTQILVEGNGKVSHSYLEEMGGVVTAGTELLDNDLEEGAPKPRELEANRPSLKNTHLETLDVHCMGDKSDYSTTVMRVGGNGRIRFAVSVTLLRPACSATINGFSLTGGAQRTDIKTNIHHIGQGTTSNQLQKNMIGGRGTGSFRGRIRVEQSAQQTNSDQLCRSILLSDRGRAWAVPSLEIIADDVQCTHGATVSDLSDEELFYLRSRGLDRMTARNLLMFAYAGDIAATIHPSMLGRVDSETGLQKRLLRRMQNVIPQGERAVKAEFQSV